MKLIRIILLAAVAAIGISACKSNRGDTAQQQVPHQQDYLIQSTLYVQQAAEYRALSWQAWNMARLRLDQMLEMRSSTRPAAVVVDIDETVLDNSPYAGWQIEEGANYSTESWQKWTSLANADTVPGALWFLRYAASRGVEVFYISNRKVAEQADTQENLRRFGFPNVDDTHFLLRSAESSKEARRQQVMQTHDILLFAGDNVEDFMALFEGQTNAERNAEIDGMHKEIGRRYIFLPNPGYGSWESAIMQYNRDWTHAQKDSIRRATLKGF